MNFNFIQPLVSMFSLVEMKCSRLFSTVSVKIQEDSGANSQICCRSKIFYGIGEKFVCAVMPKAPYQHPLLKSIHVLKCTKA